MANNQTSRRVVLGGAGDKNKDPVKSELTSIFAELGTIAKENPDEGRLMLRLMREILIDKLNARSQSAGCMNRSKASRRKALASGIR